MPTLGIVCGRHWSIFSSASAPIRAAAGPGTRTTAMAYNTYPAQRNIGELEVNLLINSGIGNVDAVNRLIANGADVNRAPTNGITPLISAIRNGHADMVRLLLEHGADANMDGAFGSTPLNEAIGGDFDADEARIDMVRLLLEHGADANRTRPLSSPPLTMASAYGNTDIARLLLEHGVDVDLEASTDGATPLFAASVNGRVAVVRLLLEHGADADKAKSDGSTPLFAASHKGHADVVKLLLEHGADADRALTWDGQTPLVVASKKGHADVVKLLLEHGADADKALTTTGATPLFIASEKGHTDVARLLLEHGADADKALTNSGATPLYAASSKGHADVVRLLLEHGASVEIPAELGTLIDSLISQSATLLSWGYLDSSADEDLLKMVQLLSVYGATRPDPDALAEKLQDFPLTRAWLEMVKSYSQMEIAASLGRIKEVGKMLRSGKPVIELFPQNVSGAMIAASAPTPEIAKFFRDVRQPWAPGRHSLFFPEYREAVKQILPLSVMRKNQEVARADWIFRVPTEIWFAILEQLPRTGNRLFDWTQFS